MDKVAAFELIRGGISSDFGCGTVASPSSTVGGGIGFF